jgi:hypothetical protein
VVQKSPRQAYLVSYLSYTDAISRFKQIHQLTNSMKNLQILSFAFLLVTVSSCSSIHKTAQQPYSSVDIRMDDFDLSEQKSAEAKSVTVLGFDFIRLFSKKTGSSGNVFASSVPVIGQFLSDPTTSYAMYKLLDENESGDFIFYPRIEKNVTCPVFGICFLYQITSVETKARVGTFK